MTTALRLSFLILLFVTGMEAPSLRAQSQSDAAAERMTISGRVIDAESGAGIAGASLRIKGTSDGTYTLTNGAFRLTAPYGSLKLVITSIAHEPREILVTPANLELEIVLQPVAIELGSVNVVAPLTAEDIIRRTIENKQANLARLRGIEGMLYSKIVLLIDGRGLGRLRIGSSSPEDDKRSIKARRKAQAEAKPFDRRNQEFILETYSKVYRDYEEDRTQVEIVRRRQTANIAEDDNLVALTEFVNFYDDVIEVAGAELTSPIADDALSYYRFSIRERIKRGRQIIFVIDVESDTELFPTFEGSLHIVNETFQLVQADLHPSDESAIPFVRDLQYTQKFEQIEDDIWFPSYLETRGTTHLDVISGAIEIELDFNATSIYENLAVNPEIPDSVFEREKTITVAAAADSADTSFWQDRSIGVLTEDERRIYAEIDSLVQSDEEDFVSIGEQFSFNSPVIPLLDFNRVESFAVGVNSIFLPGDFEIKTSLRYSFGQEKTFGSASVGTWLIDTTDLFLRVGAGIFTDVPRMPGRETYPEFFNALSALVLHSDFFDYYRADGWDLNLSAGYHGLELDLRYAEERQDSLSTSLENSPVVSETSTERYRSNLPADPGAFRTLQAQLRWGDTEPVFPGGGADIALEVDAFYGQAYRDGRDFRGIRGAAYFALPTLYTGYAPMLLRGRISGGITSDDAPTQYQAIMPHRFGLLGNFGHFFTAPTGEVGGTQYLSAYAEHNFTDFVWRLFGLPEFDDRGIELAVQGGSAYYRNTSDGALKSSGSEWFSEAGFAIGRIPTPFSNVLFLRLDAVWGVGPVAGGRFGWGISLSSPL